MHKLDRRVKLIRGFVKDVDGPPRGLKIKGPYQRLAVVIHSTPDLVSFPELGGYYFDYAFIVELCRVVAQNRQTQVTGVSKELRGSITIEELYKFWQKDSNDNDLFEELLVLENKIPIVQVKGIPYYDVGGPQPYHDSVTLEIFVAETQTKQLF